MLMSYPLDLCHAQFHGLANSRLYEEDGEVAEVPSWISNFGKSQLVTNNPWPHNWYVFHLQQRLGLL